MQREMERRIRAARRELNGYNAAIQNADGLTKAEIQKDFDKAAVKLKRQEAAYKDFSYKTGFGADPFRLQTTGFGKSISQKAVWANRREIRAIAEKQIIEEIKKESGIRGIISLQPPKIDISTLAFDIEHVEMRKHNITEEEAKKIIRNAKLSISRWNGKFIDYFLDDGAAYVDTEKDEIRTAFFANQFDEKAKKMMEVLKRHGK